MGDDDDIFFLDMGEPVKIGELATDLIHLSGLMPGRDVEVQTIGLRPGERLVEELVGDSEELASSDHASIFRLNRGGFEPVEFRHGMDRLRTLIASRDADAALAELKRLAMSS